MINSQEFKSREAGSKQNDSRITKSKQASAWWLPAIQMFLRLSAWIAIPVILALFAGKWLDKRYDSEPWLFLLSVGLAFVISMVGLVKNALREFRKIEEKNEDGNINGNTKRGEGE